MWFIRVFCFLFGLSIGLLHAQTPVDITEQMGFNKFEILRLIMEQQAKEHDREIAEREYYAKLALKQKGEKFQEIYNSIPLIFNDLAEKQHEQFTNEVNGIRNPKLDVEIKQLTHELRIRVEALWKLNK